MVDVGQPRGQRFARGMGGPVRTVRLVSSKLSTANSFVTENGTEPRLLESSIASQVRAERRQRGQAVVTVVRTDLSTPGDPWAVSVFRRNRDGFEVRAFQPATGTELSVMLAFCDIASAAASEGMPGDPFGSPKKISAETTRALYEGTPVPTPAGPRTPTPFALPRKSISKWVEQTLPHAIELYYRSGSTTPSIRLRDKYFTGLDARRSRETAEYARRDAKTRLGMPPQGTGVLPPRGAEPRSP